MNEIISKSPSVVEGKPVAARKGKPRWKQPDLVMLGRLEDLIQGVGTGKTGGDRDGDPHSPLFPPGQ